MGYRAVCLALPQLEEETIQNAYKHANFIQLFLGVFKHPENRMMPIIVDNITVNQSNANELMKHLMVCNNRRLKIANSRRGR